MLTVAREATARGTVLRLRLRDLDGKVVFSADGSGFGQAPEEAVARAAHGAVQASLTRLNSDPNDVGVPGVQVVEVYRPLVWGSSGVRLGGLEMYLAYQPISSDIATGMRTLYLVLTLGLGALYVVLAAIARFTTRRLQRYARDNAHLAEHDTLTGLPNRRLFHRRIAELTGCTGSARHRSRHRHRPLQGGQRRPRAPQRRRTAGAAGTAPGRSGPSRRHSGADRWRRVRRDLGRHPQ